jgi:ribosomal protein L11 methyltransferase
MPYRIDLDHPPDDAIDRLIELGALDVDLVHHGVAAIVPDSVAADRIARVLGCGVHVTAARGRDDGSIWVVQQRAVRVAGLEVVPADHPPRVGALRMIDGPAFGSGLHATTALCLEALSDELDASPPAAVLDVGTGSGILALAALRAGIAQVLAIDIDRDAVRVAAENARLNGFRARFTLVQGGPEALRGQWPLVVANVLAAPLIEMAPAITKLMGRGGRLVLSGIRSSLAREVERAYQRGGMHHVRTASRDGWSALPLQASW